jgi:hypothetical protein
MVEISKYRSQFSRDGSEFVPPNDRYVAYVDSEPALMLELNANGFQFYGPRALSVEEFLRNIQFVAQLSYSEFRPRTFVPQPLEIVSTFSGDIDLLR